MIAVLGCWAVLAFAFYTLGWGARKAARAVWKREVIGSVDGTVAAGAVLATLYAETASLAMPLGAAAALALLGACGGMAWTWRREMGEELREWGSALRGRGPAFWAGVAVVCGLALFWTSLGHFGYDTYNYHGPAIRWLEEYGVVKGLGNLHTRFAYNSAFLCLQALFSFTWALGRPVQAANGFLWLAAMSWCWAGLAGRGKDGLSTRVLKAVFFAGMAGWGPSVAGPTTDFPALLAMGYACIKWSEGAEGTQREGREALLGLLGVFAASVKLSAAVMGLFWAKAAWGLAAGRKWRGLAAYVAAGILAVLSFVARNAVISGYLVYPFPALDVLDVDWKIPETTVRTDAAAIRLCAREGAAWTYAGLGEGMGTWLPRYAKWFPEWVSWLALAGLAGCLVWGVAGVRTGRNGGRPAERWAGWVGMAGFAYWLATAPSPRFGSWWVGMGLAYWVQSGCGWSLGRIPERWRARSAEAGRWVLAVLCAAEFWHAAEGVRRLEGVSWRQAKGHWTMPGDDMEEWSRMAWRELGGARFYYCKRTPEGPQDGGLNGYWGFPGTECRTTLERIETRGKGLEDGFRAKKECEGVAYDFQGKLLNGEEAKCFGLDPLWQLEGAVRLEPENGGWRAQLGTERWAAGDRPGALEAWEAAARLDGGQWEAMNNLAWIRAKEGRVEEARAWMERAMANQTARESANAWDTVAMVCMASGDEAGARKAERMREALKRAGN